MVQDWHFFCRCTFFFSSALSDLSRFNPWTLWKTLKKCIRLSSTKTKVSSFLTYPFYHKPKKCKAFEKIKFEGSSRLSRKSQKCPLAKKMKNLKKFYKLRFKLREFWTWINISEWTNKISYMKGSLTKESLEVSLRREKQFPIVGFNHMHLVRKPTCDWTISVKRADPCFQLTPRALVEKRASTHSKAERHCCV